MIKDHKCLSYLETRATIYFPEEHICCDLCPLMETYSRKQCRLTGEYLLDSRLTGNYCPLAIVTEYNELEKES